MFVLTTLYFYISLFLYFILGLFSVCIWGWEWGGGAGKKGKSAMAAGGLTFYGLQLHTKLNWERQARELGCGLRGGVEESSIDLD